MDEQKRDRMVIVPPQQSKRAMATAALFTMIFNKYLTDNTCPHLQTDDEKEQFAPEILDHVIIVGGFVRDILINRPIRDIDIVINLRELCKLQTNHLKKFHAKREQQGRDIKCVYWQRYLEKFNNPDQEEQQRNNQEMEAMHSYNYIFNNQFWLNILKNNDLLKNKLSDLNRPKAGYNQVEIVNKVEIGNSNTKIDLDHQMIDFIDTFSIDKCSNDDFLAGSKNKHKHFHRKSRQLSMSGIDLTSGRGGDNAQKPTPGGDKARHSDDEEEDVMDDDDDSEHEHDHQRPERKGRLMSRVFEEVDIDKLGDDFGDFGGSFGFNNATSQNKSRQEYIAIEVPIYSGKVRYKLLNYDFSINTGIIPLSNILKLRDHNIGYDSNEFTDSMSNEHGPFTWLEICENGLGECDACEDAQVRKMLRCPESAHDHCTIEAHPTTYIFWRIVQWMIRVRDDSEWTVDKNLIKAVEKDYDDWLNEEWFAEKRNREKFFNEFRTKLETDCTSNNALADIVQMIDAMKLLRFNDRFIGLVKESNQIRYDLTDTINSIKNSKIANNQQIITKFKESGYEIAEQVFKERSVTDEQLQKAQLRIKHLTQQCEEKTEEAKKLQEDKNRLFKNNQLLQQQVDQYKEANFEQQKNNLLKQNMKLEAQVDELKGTIESLNEAMEILTKQKQNLAISTNEQIDQLRKYLIQYQNAALNRSQNGK